MRVITSIEDAGSMEGEEIGLSDWTVIDQNRIDQFAEATADHQWIHVDTERAAKEMPDGKTIAHGYLTLALYPASPPTFWNLRTLHAPSISERTRCGSIHRSLWVPEYEPGQKS